MNVTKTDPSQYMIINIDIWLLRFMLSFKWNELIMILKNINPVRPQFASFFISIWS